MGTPGPGTCTRKTRDPITSGSENQGGLFLGEPQVYRKLRLQLLKGQGTTIAQSKTQHRSRVWKVPSTCVLSEGDLLILECVLEGTGICKNFLGK